MELLIITLFISFITFLITLAYRLIQYTKNNKKIEINRPIIIIVLIIYIISSYILVNKNMLYEDRYNTIINKIEFRYNFKQTGVPLYDLVNLITEPYLLQVMDGTNGEYSQLRQELLIDIVGEEKASDLISNRDFARQIINILIDNVVYIHTIFTINIIFGMMTATFLSKLAIVYTEKQWEKHNSKNY